MIKIPKLKSHIAVSDTFIFLTFLLYGVEAAILLAAVEAYFSARRFCNKHLTVLFNSATMALSTGAIFAALAIFDLTNQNQLRGHPGFFNDFFAVLSVMTLVQFLVNTTLVSVYDSLHSREPLWETWKSKYVWTFFTYLCGAIGAGVLFIVERRIGVVIAAVRSFVVLA